jgi:hypothetical protein
LIEAAFSKFAAQAVQLSSQNGPAERASKLAHGPALRYERGQIPGGSFPHAIVAWVGRALISAEVAIR